MDNPVVFIPLLIGVILISMTFHEAMHAFMGTWLGDDTAKSEGRLTLNPVRHIDPILTIAMPLLLIMGNIVAGGGSGGFPIFGGAKPVPFNPFRVRYGDYGAALVALAGPLTNLVLAVTFALFLRVFGAGLSDFAVDIMLLFIRVNIGFFIFNMIPFPPLDGSRVLYAFAPEPVRRVMQQIESLGIMGFFLLLFIFFPILRPILFELNTNLLQFLLG